jgi:hypothetical protein
MRRIFIDNKVKIQAKEYADTMTSNAYNLLHWREDKMPLANLKRFYKYLCQNVDYQEQSRYVLNIILIYKNLQMLPPDMFEEVHQLFFKQFGEDILTVKINYDNSDQEFYKHVIDCMRYTSIRSGLMREYIKKQHIKACVYCNAQYAITTDEFEEDGKKKRIGTYQFDHFWPESKFPYLCTCYFNLQPSCPTCNDSKSDRDSLFNLYTNNEKDQDVFWFVLTPSKSLDSYVGEDMEQLQVTLNSTDTDLLKNHQKLFHIDQIYTQHIEVVQEIMVKLRSNKDSYMTSLTEGLPELFVNGIDDPKRFFYGYYMDKEHVHYRPLSKLAQDIVAIFS